MSLCVEMSRVKNVIFKCSANLLLSDLDQKSRSRGEIDEFNFHMRGIGKD